MIRPAFRVLIRFSVVAVVAAGLAACSDLPDWLGGDSTPSDEASTAADTPVSTDQPAGPQGKTVAEAGDQYPTLADTPGKAPSTSSSDEQKQVSNALVADRSQAQYSADALRAGDVTAAAPPPPASAEPSAAPPRSDNSSTAVSAPAAPPPSTASAPTPSPATAIASNAPPAPSPAVSASPPPVRPAMTDDAALGFQPSHAPPLDPSVAQMMGAPRQQRLASVARTTATAPVSVPGGAAAAVVAFPENSIGLDANGIAQVQAAVSAFKAKGGSGYVRVVGHSPSGASNLPVDKQLMQSFERSQACANSVARQLIKDGVPANRVLVDATSTLAPNEQRRAEIFF
jgi:hypothetical protein